MNLTKLLLDISINIHADKQLIYINAFIYNAK